MTRVINSALKKAAVLLLSAVIAATSFSAVSLTADSEAAAATRVPLSSVSTTIIEVAGKRMYEEAYKVLAYVNKERKAQGVEPLTIDSELTEIAMVRAAEISVSFSHSSPAGIGFISVIEGGCGENIARGYSTAKKAYNGWYTSSGHYATMTDSDFESTGIGCFKDSDGYLWWVQIFATAREGDGEYSTKNKTVSQPVEILTDTSVKYYVDEDSVDHYWKRTTVITAASKETKGKIKYKCTYCGKTKTVSVAKVKCATVSSVTYNGNARKATVTVYDVNGNIISPKYYTVTYVNHSSGKSTSTIKSVGKYYVKIKFKGNYSGTIKKSITLKPKKTSITGCMATYGNSKSITLSWTKITSCTTGYQIQYSTSSSFKNAKTKTIKNNKTSSVTLSGLKTDKKYYVRIRTYKTVKINGKSTKVYSSWSSVKNI